jgi:hypothetical protein
LELRKNSPTTAFLWHINKQLRNSLTANALQKAVFCIVKDGLLHAKRRPFRMQNMAFHKTGDNVVHPDKPFPHNQYIRKVSSSGMIVQCAKRLFQYLCIR